VSNNYISHTAVCNANVKYLNTDLKTNPNLAQNMAVYAISLRYTHPHPRFM